MPNAAPLRPLVADGRNASFARARPCWGFPWTTLILGTLIHSPQIRVLADSIAIQQTQVCQAQAKFDATAFVEEKFINTCDPVGSTLTTGGPDTYRDQDWVQSGGVRTLTAGGGASKRPNSSATKRSNSVYFVPTPQGTSRLAVSFTQPLLHGAGQAYNSSLIVLADIDTHVARDQFSKNLQSLLVDVHHAYWDLYLQLAALLLQKRKLYRQSVDILNELASRRELDVLGSQIIHARAAVANPRAAMIRYEAGVRNAGSQAGEPGERSAVAGRTGLELAPQYAHTATIFRRT